MRATINITKTESVLCNNGLPIVLAAAILALIAVTGCGSEGKKKDEVDQLAQFQTGSPLVKDNCDLEGRFFQLDKMKCLGPKCGKEITFLAKNMIRFMNSVSTSRYDDIREYTCSEGEISIDGEIRGYFDPTRPDTILWDDERSESIPTRTEHDSCDLGGRFFQLDNTKCLRFGCGKEITFLSKNMIRLTNATTSSLNEDIRSYTCENGKVSVDGDIRGQLDPNQPKMILWDGEPSVGKPQTKQDDNCDLVDRYFHLDTTECASSSCGKRIEFLASDRIRFTHNATTSLNEDVREYVCDDGEISVNGKVRGRFDSSAPQKITWDGKGSISYENLDRRYNQEHLEFCDLEGRFFHLDTTECASSSCGKRIEFLSNNRIRFTHNATTSLNEDVREYVCDEGGISVDGEVRGQFDSNEPKEIVWDGKKSIVDDNLDRRYNQDLDACDLQGKFFLLDTLECLGSGCGKAIRFLSGDKIRFTHSATTSLDEDVREYSCDEGEISVDGEIRGQFDPTQPRVIFWDGNSSVKRSSQTLSPKCKDDITCE